MIDVIVPVLGRPQNAQPLVDSLRANTTVDHRIVFMQRSPLYRKRKRDIVS